MGEVASLAEGQLGRLKSSSDRIAALHEELGAEQSRRDGLIVSLRDGGTSWGRIAAAARLSPSRCVAIVLAGSM